MGRNFDLKKIFQEAFERACIEIIIEAYHIALVEKKYSLDWYENDFSELLALYVNKIAVSSKNGEITCETEHKLPPKMNDLNKGYSDKLPRIDFFYTMTWGKERYGYPMEAKRLKEKNSCLKRAYINEGMSRFISGKYPLGTMIGYLLDGKVDSTVRGINSLLKKDKKGTEVLCFKPNKLFNAYYESKHSTIGTIKHLIFDFQID